MILFAYIRGAEQNQEAGLARHAVLPRADRHFHERGDCPCPVGSG